jgi:hypothetical protein
MSTQVSSKSDMEIPIMKNRAKGLALLSTALVIAAVSLISCSGNDTINSSAGSPGIDLGAMNYFPIVVGYSSSFAVTDASGAELRRESYSADSSVVVNGRVGVTWVQRDLSDSSVISSGVMHWNSDRSILFHTADSSQNVERLLRLPFTENAAWPRWREPGGTDGAGNGAGGGQTGNGGSSADDGSGDGSNGAGLGDGAFEDSNPLLTSFPTQGLPTFFIASLSDDITINGKAYPDCLLVVNANSDNTVNRYWYCEGVGLVKYALNVKFSESVGAINGSILQ